MKVKTLKKKLTTPIRPLNLDSTEFLLLAFVTVCLLVFFAWQTGMFPPMQSMVLGVTSFR